MGEYAGKLMPYPYHRDVAAAIAFLCKAFGLGERVSVQHGDGWIAHAELAFGDNIIMLGTPLDEDDNPNASQNGPRHGALMG